MLLLAFREKIAKNDQLLSWQGKDSRVVANLLTIQRPKV
jgi:hypothetical protein